MGVSETQNFQLGKINYPLKSLQKKKKKEFRTRYNNKSYTLHSESFL